MAVTKKCFMVWLNVTAQWWVALQTTWQKECQSVLEICCLICVICGWAFHGLTSVFLLLWLPARSRIYIMISSQFWIVWSKYMYLLSWCTAEVRNNYRSRKINFMELHQNYERRLSTHKTCFSSEDVQKEPQQKSSYCWFLSSVSGMGTFLPGSLFVPFSWECGFVLSFYGLTHLCHVDFSTLIFWLVHFH